MSFQKIKKIPLFGDRGEDVFTVQCALLAAGENLPKYGADRDFGFETKNAISSLQRKKGLPGSGIIGPITLRLLSLAVEVPPPVEKTKVPWFWKAKEMEGKKETDPAFNKEMSSKWKLVGLDLGTIAQNWAAWCGLFIAVSFAGAGIVWQKDGAGAKNWDKYGQKIEWQVNGFPQGATLRINHNGNCTESSNNHVTFANGSCSPEDLAKAGASFSGYGGNQGNAAKVSTYPVRHICAVRWPPGEPLPGKVTQSLNCSNGKTDTGESTQ